MFSTGTVASSIVCQTKTGGVSGVIFPSSPNLWCSAQSSLPESCTKLPRWAYPRRDDRIGQQHGVRRPAAVCRLAGAVEHRTGQRQVPARRKAADGDPVRQDAPTFCVLPQQPDGRAELAQRLVIPCPIAHTVGQHCGMIPRRCKLQRHRVGLAGTDVFVPAARTTSTSGRRRAFGMAGAGLRR